MKRTVGNGQSIKAMVPSASVFVLSIMLATGCEHRRETLAFSPSDQITFAIEKKGGGHTANFISRLRFDGGKWLVERRNDDGGWQDVTCQKECELVESTEQQIQELRSRARIGVRSFNCLQDMAFALCKTETRGGTEYFMVGGLEGNAPWPVRLVQLDPATFSAIR